MITAQQAFEMAKPLESQAREIVELVCKQIETAAEAKLLSINLKSEFFVRDAYSRTPMYCEVIKQLEALGYDIEFYYYESQFVDMYTIVSWDKNNEN